MTDSKFKNIVEAVKSGQIETLKANFQLWTKDIVSTPEGEQKCYEALRIADARNRKIKNPVFFMGLKNNR